MRMSVLDRILVALSTLIGMALAACVAVRAFGVDLIGKAIDGLVSASEYGKYIVAGVAAVLVLLGILVLVFMFRRAAKRVDRSFVVIDSSDKGRVRIAMSAIEEMVRQAVHSMQGASNLKIGVHNEEDAVSIGVETSVAAGEHIPTVTLNMQRSIREYVETNCGIAVRGVSVTINSVEGDMPEAMRAHESAPAQREPETWIQPVPAQEPAEEPAAGESAPEEEQPAAWEEEQPKTDEE